MFLLLHGNGLKQQKTYPATDEVETAAALQRLNIELQELHNELERLEGARMLRLSGWIKLRKISRNNLSQ